MTQRYACEFVKVVFYRLETLAVYEKRKESESSELALLQLFLVKNGKFSKVNEKKQKN